MRKVYIWVSLLSGKMVNFLYTKIVLPVVMAVSLSTSYACSSEEKAVSCTPTSGCREGRVCNVQTGMCENISIGDFVEQKDVGVQRQYDAGSLIDTIEPDVTVEKEVMYVQDVVSVPETYVNSSPETYIDLGNKDQGSDVGLKVVKGDVNCDGKFDIKDVYGMMDYLTKAKSSFTVNDDGITPCGSTPENVADVDCDGVIGVYDVCNLANHVMNAKSLQTKADGCWFVDYLKGDVDCDGKITNSDVSDLKSYLYESKKFTCLEGLEAADVNCDGQISAKDVTLLNQYVSGFRTTSYIKSDGSVCVKDSQILNKCPFK